MTSNRKMQLIASLAVMAIGGFVSAAPLSTAFTYQGRLTDDGAPAQGTYDFIFKLFSSASGAGQVGVNLTVDDVAVADGLFTVPLDFGAQFSGSALWLELSVRPGNGNGVYTILSPRQALTAVPYAQYALHGQWGPAGAGITNTTGDFVLVNRTNRIGSEYFGVHAPVAGGYGGMYISTAGPNSQPFYGYTTGTNTSWTYLDGGSNEFRIYHAGDDRVVVQDNGDVGIAVDDPNAKLDVFASTGNAIEGVTTGAFSAGVFGKGPSAGVKGEAGSSNGSGVYGVATIAGAYGVRGDNSAQGGGAVAGYANFGTGIFGQTSQGYGVYGSNGGSNLSGHAGYFNGRVHVNGTLSKSSGSFKIDHPLDPANMYLYHSFVESPDMMNIYNGVVVLDRSGEAVVTMPDYFEALNTDFRYQLTAIGGAAPELHIAREIEEGQFVVAGGEPGLKVSWQVTGVRQDAWAVANPIKVEETKPAAERGRYLHPELFGEDASMQIGFEVAPREIEDVDSAAAPADVE